MFNFTASSCDMWDETRPSFYQISNSLTLQYGQLAAGTVIIIVPVVILFAIVQRWLVEGLLAGAVKG